MQTASLPRRFAALLLDVLVLALVASAVFGGEKALSDRVDAFEVTGVVLLLAAVAYWVALEARFGATLGKYLVGIRVVRLDGGAIGFEQALRRNVTRIAGVFHLLVGFFVARGNPEGQRVGDKWAGTRVVVKAA